MNDSMLDPRTAAWLDEGPTGAPAGSFGSILAAVAAAPQEHPKLRLAGRPLRFTPRMALAAAAVVVAVTAVGGIALREPILDVLAPQHEPADLLFGFPQTRTILERSGGPEAADRTVVIGTLPKDEAFVIAASCTGSGQMRAEVWDRAVQYGPDVTEADKQPMKRLTVPCDATVTTGGFATVATASDSMEVTLDVPAGTTWRAAVGQVKGGLEEPAFPALAMTDGTVLMIDAPPVLVFGRHGPGVGLQQPPSGALVTVLVQCLGDPVTVTTDAGTPPVRLECADAAVTTRIAVPVSGAADVHAGTDGFAWVRMAAVAPAGGGPAGRPTAPPMPAGISGVGFAEGDGQNVAFGALGSNTETVVRVPESLVGQAGGDHVAIAQADGSGGSTLELWSMADAVALRTLATVADGSIFGSWVDATHEQVFYGLTKVAGTFEWRRVAFDGSGDVVIAEGPLGVRAAHAALAADDKQFVAEWCPLVGSCERAVYDAATGDTARHQLSGGIGCSILGVIDGRIVETGPSCDAPPAEGRVTAQALDGSSSVTLLDGWADGRVIAATAGPQAILAQDAGTRTTISAVALDGTGVREIASFDHEPGMGPRLSPVRLPAGDWVLLAGPLGDTPGGASASGIGPRLLNVVTGEQLELVNLPGF